VKGKEHIKASRRDILNIISRMMIEGKNKETLIELKFRDYKLKKNKVC